MNYKILIIGFGSIGKRHFEIFKDIGISEIAIISRRKLNSTNLDPRYLFNTIEEAEAANLPVGTKIIVDGKSATVK